ncbi:MAG TPA: FGGY-family carbohydrate kinase [Acidimicrobiia bacterium]|jgi:xylulokinase
MSEVTVGLDIGTSSVKAIAADADGAVIASARVPHEYRMPTPGRLEHDARVAWRDGPVAALQALGVDDVAGVCVSAMVPSLTAVDADGIPVLPGVLYGDERGREGADADAPATGMEFGGFVRWATHAAPGAAGLWPAQAVANHALGGVAAVDFATAATTHPLFDFSGWDEAAVTSLGARVDQLPRIAQMGAMVGRVGGDGPPLASGCIDGFVEQLVAGADEPGDVLVLLGTTLIVWAVAPYDAELAANDPDGYVLLPDAGAGRTRVGGPSNAGGLFCDWVARTVGAADLSTVAPDRVPVWAPYPRGERAPLNDPNRRATLDRLDLTHDAATVRRAAYEASGFVVRRAVDAARRAFGATPRRVIASGGGVRVEDWLQAIADTTGLPVECVAVPEGAALGAAFLARMAAGLESGTPGDAARWAGRGRTVEPRADWWDAVTQRYARFLALS